MSSTFKAYCFYLHTVTCCTEVSGNCFLIQSFHQRQLHSLKVHLGISPTENSVFRSVKSAFQNNKPKEGPRVLYQALVFIGVCSFVTFCSLGVSVQCAISYHSLCNNICYSACFWRLGVLDQCFMQCWWTNFNASSCLWFVTVDMQYILYIYCFYMLQFSSLALSGGRY